MRKIRFEYQPDVYSGDLVYRPLIPIVIATRYKIIDHPILAFLDSGADHNLFPAEIAERLGIMVKTGKVVVHRGVGENIHIIAYTHRVKLFVKNYSFQADIDFSFAQTHIPPLLGRAGFFRFFQSINFHEPLRFVELQY